MEFLGRVGAYGVDDADHLGVFAGAWGGAVVEYRLGVVDG